MSAGGHRMETGATAAAHAGSRGGAAAAAARWSARGGPARREVSPFHTHTQRHRRRARAHTHSSDASGRDADDAPFFLYRGPAARPRQYSFAFPLSPSRRALNRSPTARSCPFQTSHRRRRVPFSFPFGVRITPTVSPRFVFYEVVTSSLC